MLETIREYALQRLEEAGAKDELRRRHAEWFVALAESAWARLPRPSRAPGWPACRPIATTWARFWTGRWITIHRLSSNSRQHSSTRGLCAGSSTRSCHASNGRSLIPTRSNPQCGRRRSAPTGTRSRSAARTMRWRNGYSTRALHSTADSGWRVRGGRAASARHLAWARGDLDRAKALREEALATFRRIGDHQGIARALHLLGEELGGAGELESGAAMLEEAVAIDRERGDKYVFELASQPR